MGLGQVLGARYSKNEMVGVKLTMICGLWYSILFAYNSYLPQTQAAINPFFLKRAVNIPTLPGDTILLMQLIRR